MSEGPRKGEGGAVGRWKDRLAADVVRWPGLVVASLVLAGGVALAAFWPGFILRNLGQIAALLALISLWKLWIGPRARTFGAQEIEHRGNTITRGDLLLEVLCPLIVLILVLVIFHRILLGDPPLYNDHTTHLYQGWVMAERLLPSGRISGWVPSRGPGYPAGVLYPIGANLLVAAVRYATLGMMSWANVYGVAFLIAIATCHLSAYIAARMLAGRLAGVVAGLFSVVDVGAYRQSGWTFAVYWGVWPVCLSAAMAVLSVVFLHKALEKRGPRGIALSAVLAGASIVTHPMSLAFLGLALPFVIIHSMIEVGDRHPLRVGAKGVIASVAGLGVSAFWLVPFLAFRDQARTLGTGSATLHDVVDGIVRFDLFQRLWAWPMALALLAGVVAFKSRLRGVRLIVLLFSAIAVVTTSDTLLGLRLDLVMSRLANLQPDRFYLYLRVLAYILAGVAVAWLLTALRETGREALAHLSAVRRAALLVLTCVVLGSAVTPGVEALAMTELAPRFGWRGRPSFWDSYMAICEFIRDDASHRAGVVRSTWPVPCSNGDDHCFESAPIYTGIGYFHNHRYIASASFERLFDIQATQETLQLLGVRYRVGTSPRRGEQELFGAGGLHVYEVPGVSGDPFSVDGDASVTLEAWGDELYSLSVDGVSPGDRLTLHVPYFPDWHAYLDGQELPIELTDRASVRGLMTVTLTGDGALEFRYERGAPEVLGAVLTLLSLLLCVACARPRTDLRIRRIGGAVERVKAWITPRRTRTLAIWSAVVVAVIVVGVALAYLRGLSAHSREFDTVNDFPSARVWYTTGGVKRDCWRTWRQAYSCGGKEHQWVEPRYVATTIGHPRGVIFAHPQKNAVLSIEYPDVRLGKSLLGGLGITRTGSGTSPVNLSIKADGLELFKAVYRSGRGWDTFSVSTTEYDGEKVPLRFEVSCDHINGRKFVFRAWTSQTEVETAQVTGDRLLR